MYNKTHFYNKWHLWQTYFFILNQLYLIEKLKIILKRNKIVFDYKFENALSNIIILYTQSRKIRISNKVNISYNFK